jgi:hypothetical protein
MRIDKQEEQFAALLHERLRLLGFGGWGCIGPNENEDPFALDVFDLGHRLHVGGELVGFCEWTHISERRVDCRIAVTEKLGCYFDPADFGTLREIAAEWNVSAALSPGLAQVLPGSTIAILLWEETSDAIRAIQNVDDLFLTLHTATGPHRCHHTNLPTLLCPVCQEGTT